MDIQLGKLSICISLVKQLCYTLVAEKIRCNFVGPLAIWKCVSPTQFILMSLDGKLYPYLIEENRIKPGFIRTTKGNVTSMSGLRQVVKSGELLEENK